MSTISKKTTGNRGANLRADRGPAGSASREESLSAQPLRVLIVDDSEPDVESLTRMLRREFGAVTVEEADNGAAALDILRRQGADIVLVDYRLPDMDGLELLAQIEALRSEAATVLLTGQGNEQVAVQAIKRGARDYLVKRDLTAPGLQRVVSQAVQRARIDRQHQRQVEQLERTNSELDHFVRSLSHDLSANHMVLECSLAALKRTCHVQPAPELAEGVSHVEACLRESKRFVEDLAMLARTGSVHMEPARVELASVVAEVLFELEMVLAERSVVVDVEPNLPAVWCNESRIHQVISNLVRNSVKHGCDPQSPRISISRVSAPSMARDVSVAAALPSDSVWLRIHDNGRGIPAGSREEIFLPGRRLAGAHPDGSGMGLAIVKRVVEHYGGTILVDPTCADGTAFVLSLPSAP